MSFIFILIDHDQFSGGGYPRTNSSGPKRKKERKKNEILLLFQLAIKTKMIGRRAAKADASNESTELAFSFERVIDGPSFPLLWAWDSSKAGGTDWTWIGSGISTTWLFVAAAAAAWSEEEVAADTCKEECEDADAARKVAGGILSIVGGCTAGALCEASSSAPCVLHSSATLASCFSSVSIHLLLE